MINPLQSLTYILWFERESCVRGILQYVTIGAIYQIGSCHHKLGTHNSVHFTQNLIMCILCTTCAQYWFESRTTQMRTQCVHTFTMNRAFTMSVIETLPFFVFTSKSAGEKIALQEEKIVLQVCIHSPQSEYFKAVDPCWDGISQSHSELCVPQSILGWDISETFWVLHLSLNITVHSTPWKWIEKWAVGLVLEISSCSYVFLMFPCVPQTPMRPYALPT